MRTARRLIPTAPVCLAALALSVTAPAALAAPVGFRADLSAGLPGLPSAPALAAGFGPGPRTYGDTYDNEVQLMNLDYTSGRYLWDGLGGQSIPYSGAPVGVGNAYFSGEGLSAYSHEADLGSGLFRITLGIGVTAEGELIPAGLTLPSGEAIRNVYWQIGASGIGDRDGNPDAFNPFPGFASWDLLEGTITGFAGSTPIFSFAGSGTPALGLTDVDLFVELTAADGLGMTHLQMDLIARPAPAPAALLPLLELAAAGRRTR